MSNYKIIGADLKEYGPVSAEQIRQWITEGRVNSETKLQAEGERRVEAVGGSAGVRCGLAGHRPVHLSEMRRGVRGWL